MCLGSHPLGRHPPIFVHELRDAERAQLEASLRSRSAFTVGRIQIVLSSASGQPPRTIAAGLCCARHTIRNAIRASDASGMAALSAQLKQRLCAYYRTPLLQPLAQQLA